ncbi:MULTISPECIES: TolC family protein [unclassified Brevundimonas]|uniref:TolC family protein n=1 Tax=unclassified Brevundimonas TaxID=2622653 RepID=UPI000CFB3750|nr:MULTISPECIES: TolC family protein [unclassified Brevundimonas]PRA33307.1 transporter [Brevundimonas sp. MYb27]PQZ83854.1 transporter [Brevundimonas sp. MYb31]PRB13783.1 transporter [Brevundimonas sp. MYb52]PRB34484.1 transporter [Brevundimonas sp. MYb46]PRB53962.1 transporter [Brevundimonas sp. MYb33]
MPPSYRRPPRVAVGCALAAWAVLSAGSAWADPAPSFAELLSRLDQTPATLEADALTQAAEARVRQAGVRPNPMLGLEADSLFGTGPYAGTANAEATLSISQDLELWGRRAARVEAARADAGAAARQRDLAVVDAAGRLALIYAEAEAAERRAELAEESLILTVADARAALALVEQGREPLLRGIQSESEAAAARAARDEAQAERDAAFARLAAVAMLAVPVTGIDASLLDQTPSAAREAPTAAPTVRVAEAGRDAAERRITVERIRARPDVNASLGLRRYEAEDATALTFGISMPLPLFDRNRGNIDAAQAEFRAAEARLAAVRLEAQADRAAARARLAASASRVGAADAGIASAEEAYRLSRIGFEAGRISQLELRVTRAALVNARTTAVDARLARVRAEIDLARQDGRAPFQGDQ